MKAFSIILMIVGFLLAFLGWLFSWTIPEPALIVAIFGSALFSSGVISLAITQTFGKES